MITSLEDLTGFANPSGLGGHGLHGLQLQAYSGPGCTK